ncbi:metal ABC transporter permease [Sulfuricurvum sp. IAE1]|jgi:zinc transport system permease protein|uniref:metal ABC transporter permease n=1 Tax=Sulfuricurvum sp. IAE1 TaxID=2546102 RepID=UPI00104CD79B|nr:metal ABC transporter permease [Sulfuricurvum sp. IAE1]MDD3770329.1 metal ABC transporter permease [Sulfuricurvum sp.]MDX9967070.1 metal ABC transporter permease [Sulfuricurvum sp.]TDA62631.1 metal ABC transporter permease [Sulfuricurvum sp. IAE1]
MLEMFDYPFMQRAFIAGLMIAVLASLSGSFIVLRRYSLLSETLAHVSLVGVAVGLLFGIAPLWMAVAASLIASWLIEYLRSIHGMYSDSVLAIFLSGSLALAIVIVSLAGSFNASLFSYLFGSILSVSVKDLWVMGIAGGVAMALLILFFKELYFIAFDEDVARSGGIKVTMLNFMLVSVIAVIIALSIRVVGTLLIGALMVIPPVAAIRFGLGFYPTTLLSIAISLISVVIGLSASYLFSLPSGAAIVLCLLAFFIVALVINRR